VREKRNDDCGSGRCYHAATVQLDLQHHTGDRSRAGRLLVVQHYNDTGRAAEFVVQFHHEPQLRDGWHFLRDGWHFGWHFLRNGWHFKRRYGELIFIDHWRHGVRNIDHRRHGIRNIGFEHQPQWHLFVLNQ
jgi:hypothetical protein